ncbi:hypothetical protein Ait01nite_076620 [Actinoplanes italicus]|nr:hypothetical protein Ait01nite_076620 [Actinoplanes italicus]
MARQDAAEPRPATGPPGGRARAGQSSGSTPESSGRGPATGTFDPFSRVRSLIRISYRLSSIDTRVTMTGGGTREECW